MSEASDGKKPSVESGAARCVGGVLPAPVPRGGCPSDGDGVGVSAQRAGRKRAAELARLS